MINIIPILLTIFIFINISYFFILKYFNFNEIKGVGFFISIIPLLCLFIHYENQNSSYFFLYFVIILFSLIYLLDDLINLKPLTRIFIQFLSGFLILKFFFNLNDFLTYYLLISILIGLWNVFLVNVINFNDGNDGNVGFLILSFSICLLFYNFSNEINNFIIIYLILFLIIFLFFNFYLPKFYFGDSGCFALSLIINYLIINEIIINENYFFIIFLYPLIYLSIDVMYVIIFKLYKRQNLLERNYLHLYQRVKIKYGGYYYLLINIFLPIILILFNHLLLSNFFYNLYFLSIINIAILISFYFIIKYLLKL